MREAARLFMKPIILVPILAMQGWTLYAQTQGASQLPDGCPPHWWLSNGLVGQVVIFLTTVLGFGYNIYRENRNRRWDLEDRRIAREENQRAQQKVSNELAHNTTVTVNAAAAASQVAHKAEALHQRLAQIQGMFEGNGNGNGGNGGGHEHGGERTDDQAGKPGKPQG